MTTNPTPPPPSIRPTQPDRYIPVRGKDIVAALTADGGLVDEREREGLRRLSRLLAAIHHCEFFALLERLRDDYYYFAPDRDPHARFDRAAQERAYSDLTETFEGVMRAADFVEVPREEIARAHREHPVLRVTIATPTEDFRAVRFFARGRRVETFSVAGWFGRRRTLDAEIRDDVVVFAAVQPENGTKEERRHWARSRLRPGSVLLKYFRNIPTADLCTLYPNVRVVMSVRDKLMIALPGLVGAVPLGLKLVTTVSMVFLVLGAYFGAQASVENDRLTIALAVLSGTLALGAFLTQQWLQYLTRSLKHQKALADSVYFRNINNNTGLFDYIVAGAEERQTKHALLAYCFLHVAAAPQSKEALAAAVEAWLKQAFGVETRFTADEAVQKLDRLGVLVPRADLLSVLPPDQALTALEAVWANLLRGEAGGGVPERAAQ